MSISLLLCTVRVHTLEFDDVGGLIVDVEVNVLDATGDRILAGEELTKEPVLFMLRGNWINCRRDFHRR